MQIKCEHIAANCNPKANSLCFLDADTLLFGFSNNLGFYSFEQNKILFTVQDNEHEHNHINCIAIVPSQSPLILCGYDSHYLVVFGLQHGKWVKKYALKQKGRLISIEVIKAEDSFRVLTNNDSSQVSHYRVEKEQLQLQQQISFPLNRLITAMCCLTIEDTILLFIGGIDQQIHLYQKVLDQEQFVYSLSLSGHEDAIKRLAFVQQSKGGDILLASCSKDGYVRIWRITRSQQNRDFHKNGNSILKEHYLSLEAVLSAHESSVTSLTWAKFGDKIQLFSASLDCTISAWSHIDEVWSVETRLGQLIGNKNAYFDLKTDHAFKHLVALNYTGALLIWRWNNGQWELRQSFNGHSSQVSSIEWNHSGDFLVSSSKDQTTRVFAKNHLDSNYHEVSRAQIHGYDINCVTLLKIKDQTLDLLVCGADQKVIRILQPPACFANFLNTHTKANLHLYFASEAEEGKFKLSKPADPVLLYECYAEGGTQVLGLMTKMQRVQREKITNYFEQEDGDPMAEEKGEALQTSKSLSLNYAQNPHEDYLCKHTLWPEMAKLYGHPHQIHALCASSTGKMLASSCIALSKESASVILWSVPDWKIFKILNVHNYTVHAMQFSSSEKYFATASKDRQLAVFSKDFTLLHQYQAHLRAVTCLSFHLSEETLLTGSRDKTLKLHSIQLGKAIATLSLQHPVSSVAFCQLQKYQDFFAVGDVKGNIFIGIAQKDAIKVLQKVQEPFCHNQEINSLKWNGNLLASCSKDYSVRIFSILFDKN